MKHLICNQTVISVYRCIGNDFFGYFRRFRQFGKRMGNVALVGGQK